MDAANVVEFSVSLSLETARSLPRHCAGFGGQSIKHLSRKELSKTHLKLLGSTGIPKGPWTVQFTMTQQCFFRKYSINRYLIVNLAIQMSK